MSIWVALAQAGIIAAQELMEYQRVQQELAEGRISETDAWARLRATRQRYASTGRAWDDAGQQPPEPT